MTIESDTETRFATSREFDKTSANFICVSSIGFVSSLSSVIFLIPEVRENGMSQASAISLALLACVLVFVVSAFIASLDVAKRKGEVGRKEERRSRVFALFSAPFIAALLATVFSYSIP